MSIKATKAASVSREGTGQTSPREDQGRHMNPHVNVAPEKPGNILEQRVTWQQWPQRSSCNQRDPNLMSKRYRLPREPAFLQQL